MTEERDVTDDLQEYAEKLVSKQKRRYQLKWRKHRTEDAIQDLFLAGWQVWQDEKSVGLAKHRMRDRATNLLRDYASELKHEPKAVSEQPNPACGRWDEGWEEDQAQCFDPPDRASLRGDPGQELLVNEYLAQLPERQRKIVTLRLSGCTVQETADELGLSLRTVERELEKLRKDYFE